MVYYNLSCKFCITSYSSCKQYFANKLIFYSIPSQLLSFSFSLNASQIIVRIFLSQFSPLCNADALSAPLQKREGSLLPLLKLFLELVSMCQFSATRIVPHPFTKLLQMLEVYYCLFQPLSIFKMNQWVRKRKIHLTFLAYSLSYQCDTINYQVASFDATCIVQLHSQQYYYRYFLFVESRNYTFIVAVVLSALKILTHISGKLHERNSYQTLCKICS